MVVSEGGSEHDVPRAPTFKHLELSWPARYVARVTLKRPPVNALNLEMWSELEECLLYLGGESMYPAHVRAMILESGINNNINIFSAGNDLRELHVPSTTRSRFYNFWVTSTRAITTLYTSPLLTVADVGGYCPAGGCILTLACDVRILCSKSSKIGLNESAIGISVPEYWGRLFLKLADNHGRAEGLLLSGDMIGAQEALDIGLITHVDRDALHITQDMVKKYMHAGHSRTKHNLRHEFANKWLAYAPKEAQLAWDDLSSTDTVAALTAVLRRLGRPKL